MKIKLKPMKKNKLVIILLIVIALFELYTIMSLHNTIRIKDTAYQTRKERFLYDETDVQNTYKRGYVTGFALGRNSNIDITYGYRKAEPTSLMESNRALFNN